MGFREVYVPATTANLGPGYDFLGMALGFGNRVRYTLSKNKGYSIRIGGEGESLLKCDSSNMILRSCQHVFDDLGKKMPEGIEIETVNEIPVGRGLGSSASAIVAGVIIAGDLAGAEFGKDDIFRYAAQIEGHPDNVAPVVYGGMTLCYKDEAGIFAAHKLDFEAAFDVVLAIPQFQLPTSESRKVLPKCFSTEDVVYNSSNVALLIEAMRSSDYKLLAYGLRDRLHQPYRSRLIPGCDEVFDAAVEAGAYGVFLSGAGPTIAAFTAKEKSAEVGTAMQEAFGEHDIDSVIKITNIDKNGARYITKEQ